MLRTTVFSMLAVATAMFCSACATKGSNGDGTGPTSGVAGDSSAGGGGGGDSGGTPDNAPNLANPASKHCVENGGTLEMMDGPEGQFGVCVFSDKSRCEEWAYVRKQCEPGKCFDADGKCE